MVYNKLDAPDVIFVQIFGVSKPLDVDENLTDLPELENEDSERYLVITAWRPGITKHFSRLRTFVANLNSSKPFPVNVTVVRDDSKSRY